MSCSEIDGDSGDMYVTGLPPLPCEKQGEWFGKGKVEVLDPSQTLLGGSINIPDLSAQTTDTAAFYQRAVNDLTHASLTVEEVIELVEGDLELAECLAYVGANYSENVTLEDILKRRGMMFDREQGELIDCKSKWKKLWDGGKKVVHKVGKGLKKTCEKTVEFVKEHKKEILIGIGVVVGGAIIGGAVAALVSAELAAEVATATVAIAASEIQDASKKRRKDEDDDDVPDAAPSSAAGPDPQPEPQEETACVPSNRVQKFLDDLSKLAPALVSVTDPRYSIYRSEHAEKQQNRASAPASQPVPETATPLVHNVPPAQPNIFQQFFNDLLKPSSAPDPRSSIYRPEFMEKQQQSQVPVAATEPVQNQAITEVAAFEWKSPFIEHLENLVRKVMEPDFQPNAARDNPSIAEPMQPNISPGDAPAENILASLFGKIQQSLVTISHTLDEARPINGIAPVDPFHQDRPIQSSSNNADPKKAVSPLSQKFVEARHVSIPVDWVVSLPPPPDVGIVPVLSPDGKLDWLVISADWHKLNLTPDELQRGVVHFDEHLREFIPKKMDTISLVTSQNGINVTIEEFVNNCKADNLKIGCAMVNPPPKECPNLPLFVGIYNPTQGFVKDGWGAIKDMIGFGETTPVVRSTGRILGVLGTNAEDINAAFKWLHISHSRAGAILNRILETNQEVKDLMFKHGLSVALGPALPISNKMAIVAVNFYSENDNVTKWFAFPFLDDRDYDIQFLESKYISLGDFFRDDDEEPLLLKTLDKLGFVWADHARAGKTYDEALKNAINNLQEKHHFYNGQEHK